MNVVIWLTLGLLAFSGAPALAQDYRSPTPRQPAQGAPGTSTPQPFSHPEPRQLPSPAPNSPPLLNPGTGNNVRPYTPRVTPPDRDVPLLEEQRRRNSQGLGRDNLERD